LVLDKSKILSGKLFQDSFWALIGSVSARVLGLLAAIIVARLLGKDIYGEFGMIKSTLLSVAIFSTFGLGYTATKFVAEFKNGQNEKLKLFYTYSMKITLFIGCIMSIFLFLFSNNIANSVLESSHLSSSLKIVAFWVLFNALSSTQIGILSGFGEFKTMAKINTVTGITIFVLSVLFTYYFLLEGALLALVLSQMLNCYLYYRAVNKSIPVTLTNPNEKKLLKEILHFSFPIALQEASYAITSWLNYYLIIKLSNFGEMGLYSAANQWLGVVLFIPGILKNVSLLHMSKSNNDEVKHQNIFRKMLGLNLLSTLVPVIIIILSANFIAGFYGDTFTGLGRVLKVSVLSGVFLSLSNVYSQAFISRGHNWQMFWIKLFYQIGILLLFYIIMFIQNGENGAFFLGASMSIMSVLFLIACEIFYKSGFISKFSLKRF
jgi:O-antigen/teichoic acid export membrane protein